MAGRYVPVEQWSDELAMRSDHAVLARAAQWGADQELEACVELVNDWAQRLGYSHYGAELRAARRPQPPSLKEQALQMLGTNERDAHYIPEITDTIRRALEALPND